MFASIPAVLAFVNAVVYFLQSYAMIEEVDKTHMAWFALGLAAVYIFLSRQVQARQSTPENTPRCLLFPPSRGRHRFHHGSDSHSPRCPLDHHRMVRRGRVLLWVADRIKSELLNVFALAALALGVVRLLPIDNFHTTQLIFNMRMATYAVAVAVLGAVAWYAASRR